MGILNISTEKQIKEQVASSASVIAGAQILQKDVLPQGKRFNLFDLKAVILGKMLTSDGKGLQDNSADFTTEFIPVNIHFGTTLYCTASPAKCFRYDENKNPIDESSLSGAQVALTVDTKYVRLSFNNPYLETLRIAYEAVIGLTYQKYEEVLPLKVEQETFVDRNIWDKNLFDKNKASFGYYINNNNELVESGGYATTDYIPVSRKIWPTLTYKFSRGNSDITSLLGIVFYDDKLRIISYNRSSIQGTSVEIIEGASYVRLMTSYGAANPYYLVIKYSCFPISELWFDLATYKWPDGNSGYIDLTQYIAGFQISGTGNSVVPRADYKMSPLIPVTPGKKYYVNLNLYFHLYGKNRESLGRYVALANKDPYFEVPSDCHYVAVNETGYDIYNCGDRFYLKEVKEDVTIGEKIAEDDKIVAYLTTSKPPFTSVKTIKGVFENHVVLSPEQASKILYYSNNGFTGPFTTVDSSSLPNAATNEIIERVMFFWSGSHGTDLRALLFGNKNGLWCSCIASEYDSSSSYSNGDICSKSGQNYKCIADSSVTGTWDATKWEAISNEFGYFEKCDIWDLKGNHHWRVADDDKDPTGVRYRKYYPEGRTNSLGRFTYYTGPVWPRSSEQYARGLIFGNYSDSYDGSLSEPNCLFITLDGKNVYVQYEMGVYSRQYKKDDTVINNSPITSMQKGETVNFTGFSGTQSYTLKKRLSIVPSAEEKDPTVLFEYGDAINVTGISGSTVTLSDASSLSAGDHIVLTGSATGDYAKLLTSSINETTGVGDGNVFIIESISGNNIVLADSIGNPKNNLFCRHIHGVSTFGNGICLFTGEDYPKGWIVYLCPYVGSRIDNSAVNNDRWQTSVVRLNSTEQAQQRSLGVFLRSDGKMVSLSDSSGPYASRLQVRGKDIMMSNFGVYVFDLADIDNVEGQLSKIPDLNAGYCLYNIGGILLLSEYFGRTYYSTDEGDTWKYICTAGGEKNKLVGFDKNEKRFFFNFATYGQFVVEVK